MYILPIYLLSATGIYLLDGCIMPTINGNPCAQFVLSTVSRLRVTFARLWRPRKGTRRSKENLIFLISRPNTAVLLLNGDYKQDQTRNGTHLFRLPSPPTIAIGQNPPVWWCYGVGWPIQGNTYLVSVHDNAWSCEGLEQVDSLSLRICGLSWILLASGWT